MRLKILIIIILFTSLVQGSFAQTLSKKHIEEITNSIPQLISKNYVFKAKGDKISAEFQKLVDSKKYLSYNNPDSLSNILSKDLKKISNDGHMFVKNQKTNKDDDIIKNWEEKKRKMETESNYAVCPNFT